MTRVYQHFQILGYTALHSEREQHTVVMTFGNRDPSMCAAEGPLTCWLAEPFHKISLFNFQMERKAHD